MKFNTTIQSISNRRRFLKNVGASTLIAPLAVRSAVSQESLKSKTPNTWSRFRAAEFNHIALDTPRREQSIAFYEKTFGMTNISHGRTVRDTFLHFEKGFMNLGEAEVAGLNHFCLGIEDFNRDTVFQTLSNLELNPFLMGGNNLHFYDPDGFNVQVQEIGHGYGRTNPTDLTQSTKGLMQTTLIHHVSLNVSDVSRSRDFYTEMFGLRPVGEHGTDRCILSFGPGFLELCKGPKLSMNHFCLAIKNLDANTMIPKLKASGLEAVKSSESTMTIRDVSGLDVQMTAWPQT